MKKSWILFSLFNFLIAALMGLILRGAFVWGIEWVEYLNLMHGHSHIAMLGWGYLALYSLIWYRFIPIAKREKRVYSNLFWFTQITVMGMMISFPLQGYGPFSILFSSLHILASYIFCYRVWIDNSIHSPEVSLILKTALVLLIISTLGVWVLGPLAFFGNGNSILYQVAIQFYLHFQFHGWFTFGVLALFLDLIMEKGKASKWSRFKIFYLLLLISTIMTYGLVLAWAYGGNQSLWINGLGALFQLMALFLFLQLINKNTRGYMLKTLPITGIFFRFGLVSWMIKVLVQTAVLFPGIAVFSFTIRTLVIGFIHLTMLGFVSGLLIALLSNYEAFSNPTKTLFFGGTFFIAGFVLTELMLFIQGIFYWFEWGLIPYNYELLFGFSALIPLGILLLVYNKVKNWETQPDINLLVL